LAAVAILSLGGCCSGPETAQTNCPPDSVAAASQPAAFANPIFVPVVDSSCAWEHVASTVSSYFRIDHEEPVRVMNNSPVEGVLTTKAEVSPTIFEPWRHDTVDPEQRLENTLQTIRRRAMVRVTPVQGGHMVDVQVYKELEDLPKPERSTAGAATFRYDDSFTRIEDPVSGDQAPKGWIAKGRDISMEQHIIGDLMSRIGQPAMPAPTPVTAMPAAVPAAVPACPPGPSLN
jgi:hypothetical protein